MINNIEDFVKLNVEIELIEKPDKWGFHPYKMYVEDKDGNINLIVMVGIETVKQCYKLFYKYVIEEAKYIYMAVDFPAGGDMENDFVAVFDYEKNSRDFKIFAIPYNGKTGEVYERIYKNNRIFHIAHNMYTFAKQQL